MRLVTVELRRALHRRLVWVVAGIVAIIGFASAGIMLSTITPDTAANRQAAYEKAHADWQANHQQWEADCAAEKSTPPGDCALPEPQPTDPGSTYGLVSLADLVREFPAWVVFLAGVGTLLAAASLIGAEHASGNLQTWLTFVPARSRVFWAKLVPAAATAVLMLVVATLSVLGTIAVAWLVEVHSIAGLGAAAPGLGRGLLVVVLAAVCAFAIASLGRHTGAALAAAGLLVPISWFCVILAELTHSAALHRWAPSSNLIALIQGQYQFTATRDYDGPWSPAAVQTVSSVQGGLYWVVVAALLTAAALVVFRRRDLS